MRSGFACCSSLRYFGVSGRQVSPSLPEQRGFALDVVSGVHSSWKETKGWLGGIWREWIVKGKHLQVEFSEALQVQRKQETQAAQETKSADNLAGGGGFL